MTHQDLTNEVEVKAGFCDYHWFDNLEKMYNRYLFIEEAKKE